MVQTSARLLKLLSLLQTQRDWSGRGLAERLEVDVRTVRRDVDRLRGLGYPVHATPGTAGGYRLGAGAALPPLLLDDEEAVAVVVGLRTAAASAVSGIEETSVRALAKLEQVLPSRLRHRVNALQTAMVPLTGAEGPTVDADRLTAIADACRAHERLRFDYRSHDGTTSRRTVEPHRLVVAGRRWYLLAWDVGREDWRTFRVDRLTPRVPTGPRFVPRDPPEDAAAHVARGITTLVRRHRARVTLRAPAERVAEWAPRAGAVVEPIDEHSCTLHTGADSLDTLAMFLSLFGVDFEVHEPPELRDHLAVLAARLNRAAEVPRGGGPAGNTPRRATTRRRR